MLSALSLPAAATLPIETKQDVPDQPQSLNFTPLYGARIKLSSRAIS